MRLEGWETRFMAALDFARDKKYVLGEHDCFRMACRNVAAITGWDRWSEFEGKYHDKESVMRLIARYGTSFDSAMSWFFGSQPIGMLKAWRGDVAKYNDSSGEAHLGIVVGGKVALLLETGLIFVQTDACEHAWRVE